MKWRGILRERGKNFWYINEFLSFRLDVSDKNVAKNFIVIILCQIGRVAQTG